MGSDNISLDLYQTLGQLDDGNDDVDSPYQNILNCTSKYVTENELDEFFDIRNHDNVNVMHINCCCLKKIMRLLRIC